MVDNFDLYRHRVAELSSGEFYPVIALKRRKDNPEMDSNVEILFRKNVYTVADLDAVRERAYVVCAQHKARLYIKVNKRNDQDVAEAVLKHVLDAVLHKTPHLVRHAYDHCVGVTNSATNKYFLVDVDHARSLDDLEPVLAELDRLRKLGQSKPYDVLTLKTRSGFHVLAPAFNLQAFKPDLRKPVECTVMKDAETLLFAPAIAIGDAEPRCVAVEGKEDVEEDCAVFDET